MLAFRFSKTAGGQGVAAGNAGDICHCAAATVGIESDGVLGRRSHGAVIAAGVADHIRIVVIAMCFRYPALVGVGAIFSGADAVMAGFAIGGPVAVGMLMLRTETAVGADVTELILIVIIGVGCAVHFFRVWAVFDRADVIVTFGVIFPAVKGVGMAQAGGAHIAADVAVVVVVIVVDMAGFILNTAGFVRAVRVCAFMPVAVYVPAPIAVDMAAGMIRGRWNGHSRKGRRWCPRHRHRCGQPCR